MSRLRGYRLTEMAMPAVVWAVHFVAVYSMAGLACEQGWQRGRIAGLETVTWLLAGATLLSWLVLAFIARSGWRGRAAQPGADDARCVRPDQARKRFLSTVTLAMAAIAALAVLFTVIPVFLLPTCAG